MNYWINKYTQLYRDAKLSPKICDLPAKSVVMYLDDEDNGYSRVQFRDFIGWVHSVYLEELNYEFPRNVVPIDHPTPNQYDAAQYIIYNGTTQYNLCGEMCVAYIHGDSIENFLNTWKAKPNSLFKSIFGTGRARGTSAEELKDMVKVYPASRSLPVTSALNDSVSNSTLMTPERLRWWIDTGWKYIASVKISGVTGELQPTGILHWVCVDKVVPDGIGRGWVECYNPFPNQRERYSWKEFTQSAGIPYGVLVRTE